MKANKQKRKPMDYNSALNEIIEQGIEAAKSDYSKSEEKHRLNGSIAGFEACRGLNPQQLKELHDNSRIKTWDSFNSANEGLIKSEDYWYVRCYEAEVEWVCNVISAILINQGLKPIIIPTARGFMQAALVVGVKGEEDGRYRRGVEDCSC